MKQQPDLVDGALTTALRKHLQLRPEHRTRLRQRGLSDEWIDAKGYRSTPRTAQDRDDVASALAPYLEAFGGGVPGFFFDGNRWRMVYAGAGFFVPSRDEHGRVQALCYRVDEPRDGSKYLWLSTNAETEDDRGRQKYPQGATSGTPTHFTNRAAMWDADELLVTEGVLKADVIAALTGLPVVGVAGTHCTRGLAARLRSNIPRLARVVVAFDKDVLTKPHVALGLERLITQLEGEHFRVRVRMWPGEAKGFDDYLLEQSRAQEVAA
jgi:DNA primase